MAASRAARRALARGGSSAVKSFDQIPGPRIWPIVGSALQYRFGPYEKTQYHRALEDMYREYGPLVKEKIGNKYIVHVFDLEDIKTVYSFEGKYPVVPPLQETTQMYRAQKDMSLGLGNTNGEEWYKLRANSQQKMLRPKEVAHHLPSVDTIAKDLLDRLSRVRDDNNQVADLRLEIGRWSLENAASLVFDQRLGCLEDGSAGEEWGRKMVEANAAIFELSGDLKLSLPFYKVISTPKWRQLVANEDQFYSEAIELVDKTLVRLKEGLESGNLKDNELNFMRYLLSRKALNLKDVTVICLSLFTDGLSTTTPTLLFNLYSLASCRDTAVMHKLRQEVDSIAPYNAPMTTETLSKLPYLKAFVKETFRLWPNGTEVSRYTEQDITLSGYEIPVGTHVDLNPSVHFRDGKIFRDPDCHIPERWIREDDGSPKDDIHPYLLTPFGHGTRMCAGRRFAEQDLYTVLARIISRFDLSLPEGDVMGQKYNTLLFPDRPIRIRFADRNV